MSETKTSAAKVLVADDDPAILRLVRTVIEGEGYTALSARDGKEAYSILQSGEPIIAAIVDIVMPYIEGTELIRFMQSEKRFKHIPVIIMTAEQNPRLSSESFGAGAVAFLPKPFSNTQLKMMLQMFVKAKR